MANLEFRANKRQRMIREGKKIQEFEPTETELILTIVKGFVTDERKPSKGPEYYRVLAWIDNEDKPYRTKFVTGSKGFSRFDKKIEIPIDSPAYRYLHVELVRVASWRDPGTSNGNIVMGRARIKLPPWTSGKEFTSYVDLVGLNNDGCVLVKGYLKLSMKLQRYVVV